MATPTFSPDELTEMARQLEQPPTVRYEVFARAGRGEWLHIPFAAAGEFSHPRVMPEFCLLPAVLATYLHDQDIHAGDWQLRAVDAATGALVAVATIQGGI